MDCSEGRFWSVIDADETELVPPYLSGKQPYLFLPPRRLRTLFIFLWILKLVIGGILPAM